MTEVVSGFIGVKKQPDGSWMATVHPQSGGQGSRPVTDGWATLQALAREFPGRDIRWEETGDWTQFRSEHGPSPESGWPE